MSAVHLVSVIGCRRRIICSTSNLEVLIWYMVDDGDIVWHNVHDGVSPMN